MPDMPVTIEVKIKGTITIRSRRRKISPSLPAGPAKSGRKMATKLKVYAGPDHPHVSQKPEELKLG